MSNLMFPTDKYTLQIFPMSVALYETLSAGDHGGRGAVPPAGLSVPHHDRQGAEHGPVPRLSICLLHLLQVRGLATHVLVLYDSLDKHTMECLPAR